MQILLNQHCQHYSKDTPPLSNQEIKDLLNQVDDWKLTSTTQKIEKTFKFENYYQTIAFVNAVAFIIHEQDHHPEINITYNTCSIAFTTHSTGALSLNDFICAALINNTMLNVKNL